MTHASLTSNLHGAKPFNQTELPLWGGTAPTYNGELAVDASNGQPLLGYDSTAGEAGWYLAMDPTTRLPVAHAYPSEPTINNVTTTEIWAGLCAAHIDDSAQSTVTVEQNGAGDYLSAVTFSASSATKIVTLYVCAPPDFSGWDANGIRILTRIVHTSGSSDITLEVMDPASGASFGTPKTATRTSVVATEASYSYLTISGATLSTGYSAGDLIKIVITCANTTGTSAFRLSLLELNWN